MLKRSAQAGACALLLSVGMVNVAEARIYAGGGFGVSTYDYEDVDNGSATKLFLGYEQVESPVYFELALIDSGESDIEGTGVTINVSGLSFGVGYRGVMNHDTGSAFFLKGGLYKTDTELSDGFNSVSDGNSGLFIGFGGDLMLNPSFGLRFDMEGLLGVEDYADDKNVTLITFGALFKFGAEQ